MPQDTPVSLDQDLTVPAADHTPEMTLFADDTAVVMRANGRPERFGTTIGRLSGPLQLGAFQAVRWEDGTEDYVDPRALQRA